MKITKQDVEYSIKNRVFNPNNYENMEVVSTVFGRREEKNELIKELLDAYPEVDGIYCDQWHNMMAFRILSNN